MALELAQWRVFLTAADCGSLANAAELLHTDQPALSRSLKRLEVLLGAPLFDRSSRGLTPTELGRRLLEPARELLDHSDALDGLAFAEARQTSGILKVGAVDIYPITSAIVTACRELTVEGRPIATELVHLPWLAHAQAVMKRAIDVGFTLTVDGRLPEPRTMRSQPVWTETDVFALISAAHPLAEADLIDPQQLAELPLYLPGKNDSPDVYNLILETLAAAGVPAPRRAPQRASFAEAIASVGVGDGWLVSARSLARHPPAGLAVIPLAVTLKSNLQAELIWHVNTDAATVKTFVDRMLRGLAAG